MAEIQKPEYRGAKRLNIASAKATGRSPSNISLPQSFKPTHELQMAKIVAEGTLDIIDAYQAAKQTATRLEVSEEDALLQKHIGEQKMKVTGNLITAGPNQLLPGDMESNFIADGHKIGEDTITPYVVSEELSDDAKKLIQPKIDAANNSFNIDTQNIFTKELVDRSKIAIKNRRNKELNGFQNYMTHITRKGVEKPTGLYEPNKNQIAENTAKQYEAFLQTEIKNKNLNDVQADLMLHEFKEELAGTILSRHLAQNPEEALKQYAEKPYMVGGVPVDSARVSKFIDSYIQSKESKRIASESNTYSINMLSYATQQPEEVLRLYSDDIGKNSEMMKSRIASGDFDDYDKAMQKERRHIVPNYEMLSDDKPYLTPELLEKMIVTAVKGQKALESERQALKGQKFLALLKHGLYSPTLQYSQYYKNTHYKWVDGQGFLPKPEAVLKTARLYGLKPIEVETAYIKAIATIKTNIKPGSGMIGGDPAFKKFQDQVLQYWNDQIFEDRGIEDAQRALPNEEPYIQDPLKLPEGKENYRQMNKIQQYTMDAMVHDLMNLKEDYRNVGQMPLPDLMKKHAYYEDRFNNKDWTFEIQGKVWNNIKNVRWNVRVQDLLQRPVGAVGKDLGLLDKMLKYPGPIGNPIELNRNEKALVIKQMKYLDGGSGLIWKPGTKVNKQLFVPNEYWENQLELLGTKESRAIKKAKALEQAKILKN